MIVQNNILFFTYQELKGALDLSRRQCLRMPSIKNVNDSRCALYQINLLPQKHFKQLQETFGDLEVLKLQCQVSKELVISKSEMQFIENYTYNNDIFLPDSVVKNYQESIKYLHLLQSDYSALGFASKTEFYKSVIRLIKAFKIDLPSSVRGLRRKLSEFKSNGPEAVISKKFGNTNKAKISKEISAFLLAQFSQPNIYISVPDLSIMYDNIRDEKGWPELSTRAISSFLNKPAIKRLWKLGKHGEKSSEYKRLYQHYLDLEQAKNSDSLWVIDGTKIDFWYQDKKGIAAKLKMNVVIDAHSEAIIGIHFSESEKIQDHKAVLFDAMKTANAKPFQVLYDNQSGHKSAIMQAVYKGIVAKGGTHYPARAYNSQSKQIEQLFNRFQKSVLRKFWFSDGQSITAKKAANKLNAEFLLKSRHRLPFKEDIFKLKDAIVSIWNNAKHPKDNLSRMQRYFAGKTESNEPVNQRLFVELFYSTSKRKVTYRRGGLIATINRKEYSFEVYDGNNIDLKFRRHYTGQQFIIKYDPNNLDHVYLFLPFGDDLRFVALAKSKNIHTQVLADQLIGSKSDWAKDFETRDDELAQDKKELEAVRVAASISPEDLFSDVHDVHRKMGAFAPKDKRSDSDSDVGGLLQQL